MVKFRTLKNSYVKEKMDYKHYNTEEETFLFRMIEEAEESIRKEGTITLEEFREFIRSELHVAL